MWSAGTTSATRWPIPGAALLLSYVLTVAVSVAAGVDAVTSAFPALAPYPVEMAVAFVLIIA